MKPVRHLLLTLFVASTFLFMGFYFTTGDWTVPESAKAVQNPFKGDAAATAEGKKTFNKYCVACHGTKGKGDGPAGIALNPRPANFASTKVITDTDGALYWKMTTGRPPMASYAKILTDAQRWQLVNYIRELQQPPVPKSK